MLTKRRYRAFGLHVTFHFKVEDWVAQNVAKYVPARLYFNEDADLDEGRTNPEWFAEVGGTNEVD